MLFPAEPGLLLRVQGDFCMADRYQHQKQLNQG